MSIQRIKRRRGKRAIFILCIVAFLVFLIWWIIPSSILTKKAAELVLSSEKETKISDLYKYNFFDLYKEIKEENNIEINNLQKEVLYTNEYSFDIKIEEFEEIKEYRIEVLINDDEVLNCTLEKDEEEFLIDLGKEGIKNLRFIVYVDNEICREEELTVAYVKPYQKQFLDELSRRGVIVHYTDGSWEKFDKSVDLLQQLGVKNVRATLSWEKIEKDDKNDIFDFSGYDEWIKGLTERGINIIACFNGFQGHCGLDGKINTEEEEKEFLKFASKVIERYPQIKNYEFINEPNYKLQKYITDDDVKWYSDVLKELSNNYDVNVITGGTSTPEADTSDYITSETFYNKLYDNSAYNYILNVNFHPYDSVNSEEQNQRFYKKINTHENLYNEQGGFLNKYVTEYGVHFYNQNKQADKIIQQTVILDKYNIEKSMLYNFWCVGTDPNNAEHNYGIITNDYLPKKSYYALKNYYENTNGSEYIGTVNLKEGLEAHVYNKDGKPKIIVWSNNSDNTIQIDYTGFTAKDIYGKEILNTDGNLNITTSPVYLDNISTNYFYQAISNVSVEKYQEFTEKYQAQLQNVPELINKIDNLEATMENIKNLDIISEEQAKQLMEEHFKLGNQLIESYQTKKIDVEYVKLSSMLDMLNEIGNSYEDLITVSAVKRTSDLTDTKKLIDEVEELINDNNDLEIIYPSKILEFSKDLYEKVEYINSLEEENDIKTGLIVSKDLHAKYLAEWAKQFTNIYIEEYIKNNPITITYSTQELTNKDVIATLNIGTDCTITNNDNKNVYTFNQNGEFEFEYVRRGRNFKEKAIVSNIDKTNPKIIGLESEQVYSSAVVFKVEDENFDKVEILINDSLLENYEIGQELKEEGKYNVKAIDKAGNTSEIIFYIMYFDEETYQIEGNKICNIVSNTKTENISQNLPIKEQYVIKRNDRQLEANEVVATGDVIELESGKKYTLIVKGDVNSDGAVNITDLVRTQNFILGRRTATEIEESAADANFDKEQITIKDLVRIQIMILNPPTT